MLFHKILVPLDASDLSERAIDVALKLAGAFGSEVVLLSVRPEKIELQDPEQTPDQLDSFEDEAHRMKEMARRHIADTGAVEDLIRAEVRAGNPLDAIVTAANDLMVDLIVMGTHGRVGIIDQLVGSTTERVLPRVSASVLVVKPLGYPYLRE